MFLMISEVSSPSTLLSAKSTPFDGGHDSRDLLADSADAGQAGVPHSVLADRRGLTFLLRMLGNSCTGATERPSAALVVEFSTGGAVACPGSRGSEIRGIVVPQQKRSPRQSGRPA